MRVTDALIIAAGRGSRFGTATNGRPKPMLSIAGIPLIARTILSARKAGIDRFAVITGYRRKVLETYISRQFPETDCIYNEQWRLPNGHSVLRGKGRIRGPFVLLMADHLFEPGILERLLASPLKPGKCRLAVDYRPDTIPDLADATKVETRNGLIRNIGKTIRNYNAVDTGCFLCSEAIFTALEAAISRGEGSLSDGIRVLARSGLMEAVDTEGLFWRDIDDEAALKEAEGQLKKVSSSEFRVWSQGQDIPPRR